MDLKVQVDVFTSFISNLYMDLKVQVDVFTSFISNSFCEKIKPTTVICSFCELIRQPIKLLNYFCVLADFTGAGPDAEIPKSVISIGVLAGALVIGLIIAKVVNVIYDRQDIRDDASDIRYAEGQAI